jgi:uncharacterized protein involved in exopolysaccharide biosynthesis
MDMNRLFNMLARMFIRSATDAGIDAATRTGKPVSEMTPEERQQAKAAKATAQKFRQMTRLGRRFFR